MNDASASTIGDVILFRINVTVSDVLEGTFHFRQNLRNRNADKTFKEQIILNGIEAKEYVLSCQKKYRIPEEEHEQTKKRLKNYKRSQRNIMRIKSKLKTGNKMLLTLDGDILEKNAEFVLIDGKKHRYDIAYDIPSTIGVKVEELQFNEVEFI